MCYSTKRKIADCVKELMKKKDIKKITIQDIMQATYMSRQSFYYHFSDIYHVLEWICKYDFVKKIVYKEGQSAREWIFHLLKVAEAEQNTFRRIAFEIKWPKIVDYIKFPLMEQLQKMTGRDCEELEYPTMTLAYYLLDFVCHKRKSEDEAVMRELEVLIEYLEREKLYNFINLSKDVIEKISYN